jgi:adenylate kinase
MLLGPPGSGKGTVAEKLRGRWGFVHVATGDMLREEVKQGSAVGREAEGYMKRGELAPDEIIIRIVEARLDSGGQNAAYLFDGFPRTTAQADLLDASLARRGARIQHVFFLDAPRAVLIQRLTGRRVCRQCGANYHVANVPPKKEGICDACGGELYQRKDDGEATIVNRLDVYNRQTESLIARYEQQGILARLNSNQDVNRLLAAMGRLLEAGQRTGGKAKAGSGSGP